MDTGNHKLNIELVTPSRIVLNDSADMIVVPGTEGDLGILVCHAPMISSLRLGVLKTEGREQGDEAIFVSGGFVEVTGSRCTVIAEEAHFLDQVDVKEVQQRLEDANAIIANDNASEAVVTKAKKDKDVATALLEFLS
ncbi:MAG: ATP synthase F1 subunit epsilon [Rickettsiales bacterium]|nr:ATP synthase F1 subunit epsilon [Rickettsiales bacterium]